MKERCALLPQDYHRFHFPFSGTLVSSTDIAGHYYTVNPIAGKKDTAVRCPFAAFHRLSPWSVAVNHENVNVFTENRRCVSVFDTPAGKVVLVRDPTNMDYDPT